MLRQYKYQIISFFTGFALLTYELAAARILAPTIGSSTYVWTSVIGVIIAALSLGFYVGGRVADRRDRSTDLVWLLLAASLAATATLLMYEGILTSLADWDADRRVQAVIAALLLFAPTSFFIGMTSPYLAKLNVDSLKSTGRSVAALDMFNALGGIIGTFVTGFFIFTIIGSRETIGLVALLLLLLSWAQFRYKGRTALRFAISFVILLSTLGPQSTKAGAIEIDTPSAHYTVVNGFIDNFGVTGLMTGPSGTQSAVYTSGSDELVFWYTKMMAELTVSRSPDRILMLGGGAFTLPQYLSARLPDAQIDAVEIDPQLEQIAKDYFNYRNPKNVREIFDDARAYVSQTDQRYDVILVDVYGDTSIPFSLTTKDFAREVASILKPQGLLVANIIAGPQGPCQQVLETIDAAYRSELPQVEYAVDPAGKNAVRANHVLAYSREAIDSSVLDPLATSGTVPFTDNFAPVERLYYDCQSLR